MVDIYIDPITGDLDLPDGKARLVKSIDEMARQKIAITLDTNRGEWVFNIQFGIPYLKNANNNIQLLGKTDLKVVDAYIQEAILSKPGIRHIEWYESTLDRDNRRSSIRFKAITEEGDIVEGGSVIQV